MCSPPSPTRSRTRGHRTATAPMPVTISRSGRCPWRTSRRRPSSVNLSVWVLSQAATSASTACPNSVLAPLRKTSVSGSENVPGWVSSKTLASVTAYHSFGGEVEALNTPPIRRLTPSCRHQLSALAQDAVLPIALLPHRDVRDDFLFLDQPAEELARPIGRVRGEPPRPQAEALFCSIQHRLCRGNFIVGARRRCLDIYDYCILDVDEVVQPISELHALVGLGCPCRLRVRRRDHLW